MQSLEKTVTGVVSNVRTLNAKSADTKKLFATMKKNFESLARDIEETNTMIKDMGTFTAQLQETQHLNAIQMRATDTRQSVLENKHNTLEINSDARSDRMEAQFAQIMNMLSGATVSHPMAEVPSQSKRGSDSVSDMTYSQGTPHRQKKQATAQTPPRIHKSKQNSIFHTQLSTTDIEDDDPTTSNL